MYTKAFPIDRQLDIMDCGPASLKMIAKHYKKYYSLQYKHLLISVTTRLLILNLSKVIGFRVLDEGNLLEFWNEERPQGWVWEVVENEKLLYALFKTGRPKAEWLKYQAQTIRRRKDLRPSSHRAILYVNYELIWRYAGTFRDFSRSHSRCPSMTWINLSANLPSLSKITPSSLAIKDFSTRFSAPFAKARALQ